MLWSQVPPEVKLTLHALHTGGTASFQAMDRLLQIQPRHQKKLLPLATHCFSPVKGCCPLLLLTQQVV